MTTWNEELLHALLSTRGEEALFKKITSIAQDLGFTYCAYGMRTPLPLTQPKTVMFNNYPVAWQKLYQEKNYLAVDPTVQQGMRSLLPTTWSDSTSASSPEFWEDAYSFGLRFGWAQASSSADGTRGMLTLARSDDPLSEAELKDKSLKMMWLSQTAHQGMASCLAGKLMPETTQKLSEREVEILRWTAEGKTSGEIAQIVGITERTVNFHINNAMIKLNATNKTAAVVRAVVLGLLLM